MIRAVLLLLALISWASDAAFEHQTSSSPSRLKSVELEEQVDRRQFLSGIAIGSFLAIGFGGSEGANAVVQAINSAEQTCREEGNCLEKGDWDGAVGWNWGGKDRCDPTDPRCGVNGVLGEGPIAAPVPPMVAKVTHVVELSCTIGREEAGVLRFGLYGEACPESVKTLLAFLTIPGLSTSAQLELENGFESVSAPVTMANGFGLLNAIIPNERLVFGIASQANAFARSRGLSKAGENFRPQPRPQKTETELSPRKHDAAGLLSIPGDGLGYANKGGDDDGAFENAFEITAAAVPSMDKGNRKVVGQVMDDSSMAFLARLASLPTRKGLKGVIPGQNSGPPLLKVAVKDVFVSKAPSSEMTA